ncbi:iron complex outermembrane receptor protein [Methylohalomonas lacus]|uniref:Iron complex outermembrane receptor protein n=1 Tax=Methylohalomonas lacus TaxID=398773 RepID=A0AAE3HIY5_9GAMM|nr:TonB-dependent receptor [Methylohalomonas lacus]MCS3903244.1 iron complex outermembrane receptor protein [Methylohalomonas lacus]
MKIHRHGLTGAGVALVMSGLPLALSAQTDSETEQLDEVTVTSPRVETPINKVPYAIDLVGKDDIQRGTQQLGLDESLTKIPGVFMLNRYNFAQDLRIAIRGFGARADFGIRGIKIIVDGIPQTLPDGQGNIDTIDLASAERIEVIRGPSSSLYGASSGGVINIISEEGPADPFVEGRYSYGSYGFHKYNLKTGGQKGDLNYLFNIGRYEIDGYRDHSETESIIGNAKLVYDIDETSDLTTIINFSDSPRANDPGGLTIEEVREDRKQARDRADLLNTGESKEEQRLGFVYRKDLAPQHEIKLRNYYVFTDFDNSLPFGPGVGAGTGGQVAFDRFFVGGGAQYTFKGANNRFTTGFDIESQQDDRQNFNNLLGGQRGALVLDQEEDVSSIGLFAQNEQYLTDTITLTTGIRYDKVEFDVDDKFLSDGDDSGKVDYEEVSPLVGLLWSPIRNFNIYGNVSRSFETPSTTEFSNVAGSGGFNTSLNAQTATNYEIGIKGAVPQWHGFTYNAAVFRIDGEDELVVDDVDQNLFNNAGETTREGFELALSVQPTANLTASLAYTYSDFKYDTFRPEISTGFTTPPVQANFDGNRLPGIPKHFGQIELAYEHPSGFYGVWDTLLVGELFTDDTNNTEVAGYGVSNLRAGYSTRVGDTQIEPFIGINNIFDKEYFSNIRINDTSSRFYEPAPEINAYAGISIRHDFL